MKPRYKSIKELAAEIRRSNARFERATPAQKRIMIARDVLKQVRLGVYQPTEGTYVRVDSLQLRRKVVNPHPWSSDVNLQPPLVDGTLECKVCGIGSLVMSTIRFRNKITTLDINEVADGRPDPFCEKTSELGFPDIFTAKQRALIESAFEGSNFGVNQKDMERCRKFWRRHATTTDTLVAIMKNIINNGGRFRP